MEHSLFWLGALALSLAIYSIMVMIRRYVDHPDHPDNPVTSPKGPPDQVLIEAQWEVDEMLPGTVAIAAYPRPALSMLTLAEKAWLEARMGADGVLRTQGLICPNPRAFTTLTDITPAGGLLSVEEARELGIPLRVEIDALHRKSRSVAPKNKIGY